MLKLIDTPPLWLGLCIAAAYGLDRLAPGLGAGWYWLQIAGLGLVGAGVAIMALAFREFLRAGTSVIPRRVPSAFLQHGVYRISRNPIYLADALILLGLILYWDVLVALVLVPLFMSLITRRYILGEEAGLEAKFGAQFATWKSSVRRWI